MLCAAPRPGVEVLDYRLEQENPPRNKRSGKKLSAIVGGRAREQHPSEVDSIMLHQTACVFGGSDPYRRALDVAAHAVAYPGKLVLSAPISWYMYHGNGGNKRSRGLEIQGHFGGLADDPRTPVREDIETIWRKTEPTPFTDDLIEAAREGVRRLYVEASEWGADIKYVLAHRQFSPTRRSDPGELIWRAVVIEYAIPVLGLEPLPGLSQDGGRPVPREWQPNGGMGRY